MTGASSLTTKARLTRPPTADLVLSACLVVAAILTSYVAIHDPQNGIRVASSWWEWLLVVAPALPVAFRRVDPLRATPICILAQITLWGSGLESPFIAPMIMIYTVCADGGTRGRQLGIGSGVALCAMTTLGVFVADDVTVDLLVFTAIASAVTYVLGVNSARQRNAEVKLAEELAIARVERDSARDRAAANERQRIARELHDIVGHSLSVIAVRAEAADRVAPKNPGAAVDAVAAIATTARSSLAEVRRVLVGLRNEDSELELAPVPSLASLPTLVSSFSEAGLDVSLASDLPDDAAVGAAVGAGTYRIVQEALTNVLKHGGPEASATLRLDFDQGELVVHVDDDGRGVTSEMNGEAGSGLTGMSERAEVLGGSLTAGPRSGGGYRVAVSLPVDATVSR